MSRAIALMTLSGDLDCSGRDGLEEAFARLRDFDIAILDFNDVTFFDSSAIHCLVMLRKRMVRAGREGRIRIVHPSEAVRKVLQICKLDTIFGIDDGPVDRDGAATFVAAHDAGASAEGQESMRSNSRALIP